MFKKYQRLMVVKPNTPHEIEVYYLTDYMGEVFKSGTMKQMTILICQSLDKEILHIPACDILDIFNAVE
jgi:hypothetical protein